MDTERLKQQLRFHEGMRPKPYHCTSGRLTIGIGRNLDDVGISETEAMFLLENDIKRATEGARALFSTFDALGDVRQRVLVDMCLNLGEAGLTEFRQTRQAIDSGNFEGAAAEMLDSRWATQVGPRATRLSEMMRTGEDSHDF